jgi:glycosyltransferase involved in cell wall biosynthesis
MEITLIIPAYNEEKEIAACIDAAQKSARGRFKEIIVVDNASTDTTGEVARAFGARVVREEKKGLPHARQAGLDAATTEYVAYIDADTHLSESWYDVAEKYLVRYPDAVALSGPRRYFGTTLLRRSVLYAFWIPTPVIYRMVGYMILGGNFIAKKSALQKMGGFNMAIEFYGEDTDIARRLSAIGKVLFRTDFFVYASARRFETEGLFKPNITYAVNYLWPVVFGRPYTKAYSDVRNS